MFLPVIQHELQSCSTRIIGKKKSASVNCVMIYYRFLLHVYQHGSSCDKIFSILVYLPTSTPKIQLHSEVWE